MKIIRIIEAAMLAVVLLTLQGCNRLDDNAAPKYGSDTGAPVNCRAYVQLSIDEYRAGKYSAKDAMTGLERNCGLYGQIWIDNRHK